jgi:hypothetical protein
LSKAYKKPPPPAPAKATPKLKEAYLKTQKPKTKLNTNLQHMVQSVLGDSQPNRVGNQVPL